MLGHFNLPGLTSYVYKYHSLSSLASPLDRFTMSRIPLFSKQLKDPSDVLICDLPGLSLARNETVRTSPRSSRDFQNVVSSVMYNNQKGIIVLSRSITVKHISTYEILMMLQLNAPVLTSPSHLLSYMNYSFAYYGRVLKFHITPIMLGFSYSFHYKMAVRVSIFKLVQWCFLKI